MFTRLDADDCDVPRPPTPCAAASDDDDLTAALAGCGLGGGDELSGWEAAVGTLDVDGEWDGAVSPPQPGGSDGGSAGSSPA